MASSTIPACHHHRRCDRFAPATRTLGVWLAAGASVLTPLFSGQPVAQAADRAWSTTPPTNLFSGLNWTAGNTPGAPGTAVASGDGLFFGASTLTSLLNDNTGFTYAGLTFNAGASAFTIGGNAFTLGGSLTNNTAAIQTLNTDIALNAARTVTIAAGGGSLVLNGGISGGFNLTVATAFTSGGSANALPINPLVLGGTNTFTGNLVLSNAAVRLTNVNALGNGTTNVSAVTLPNVAGVGTNVLIFGTDTAITNSAIALNLATNLTFGTNSLVLDRATPGAGVTQTVGSLTFQAQSLVRVVGGPNATSPGTLNVNGTTTISGLGTSARTAVLFAADANIALKAINATAANTTVLLDGTSTGNVVTGAIDALGLVKAGTGTWTLSGASTTLGGATVSGGTLRLDFSAAGAPAANILPGGSGLTLNGGTLAVMAGAGAASQSFANGTVLSAGGSHLVLGSTGGGAVAVNLGPVFRTAGGTLDITLPAGAQSVTNGVTTTTLNATNGLLNVPGTGGGTVTVNGVDFAANLTNTSGGNIGAFTAYTALPTATGQTAGVGSVRSLTASQTQTGATSFAALRISDTGAGQSLDLSGNNLTLLDGTTILQAGGATGTYLIDSTVAGSRIATTGGTGEIILNTAAGQTLTIGSSSNNLRQASDTTAFTKTGDGTVVIGSPLFFQGNASSGANGTIRVTGGVLSTVSLPGGAGSIYLNGGTLRWTGSSTGTINSNVGLVLGGNGGTLDGSGVGAFNLNSSGAVTFENTAASARLTLTGSGPATNVFAPSGGLNDPRAAASGGTSLVKTGTGTWSVGFGNNSYSGGTSILGGTLILTGGGFVPASPFTSTSGLGVGSVVVGDGAGQNATLTANTPGVPGTIAFAGASNLTVNAGSTLWPGFLNVVGRQTDSSPAFGSATLNLAAGSNLAVGIDGIFAFDRIRLVGDVALGGANLVLTLGPNVIPTGQQFIIIDNDGTTDLIGGLLTNGFSVVAANNTGAYLFTINYNGGDGNDLVLNGIGIVPEPGTWAIIAVGCAALLILSRLRSQRDDGCRRVSGRRTSSGDS